MDFCMNSHVVIEFPKKAIIINAHDKDSSTEIAFVNARRNMDSPVARANDLRTAYFPLLPQLDRGVGPSISDPPTLLYNARLPDKNMCLDQLTAEEATFCNEVYDLTSENAEEVNDEGQARDPYSPNKYKGMHSASAAGKSEHADAKVVRNVEVRSLNPGSRKGTGRQIELQGRSDTTVRFIDGMEGPGVREGNCELSLDRIKVEKNLSCGEKCRLLEMLHKYTTHFVKRPGKCKNFEYRLQMQGGLPKSCNSRPKPFSLRREVREQIKEMVENDILEISHSPHVNPLTIVRRKNKAVRICVDARQVNKYIPDRTKTPPAQELLQRCHGAKYISSIDLNNAFLQIPLEESPRVWTAFHFDGQKYRFTRVPFGFRNSLGSFIRALQFVLGSDSTEYVLNYVNDIIVYSKTFEEHIEHLDDVIGKGL
jgi:hypothetical protein